VPSVLLLHAGVNGGYAAGVNLGLAQLAAHRDVNRFWVLNPDSAVPPDTPRAFATEGGPGLRFSLMGGRVNYLEDPDRIQIDGGRINWLTGATSNLNQGDSHEACPVPDTRDIDFISGASMVASREFYETAGPMQEDYFLYYEEVDWAMHRGNLPLAYCANGLVYHRAGTSIGSPVPGQVGSAMSIFFKHRNRMRFIRRYRPWSWAFGQAFTVGKAAQTLLKGHPREALVLLGAAFDLSPPPAVRKRLSPDAAMRAFGRRGGAGR
jgi:GT2 family glycosyltransferase